MPIAQSTRSTVAGRAIGTLTRHWAREIRTAATASQSLLEDAAAYPCAPSLGLAVRTYPRRVSGALRFMIT